MTRLGGWLDRLDGWARVAVFVAVAAAFSVAVVLAVAGPSPVAHAPAQRAAALGAPGAAPGPVTGPEISDPASPAMAASPSSTTQRPVAPDDLAAAEATARDFALAYATAEPGERARDVVRRVEPHVTPALAGRLGRDLRLSAPPADGRTVDVVVEHVHAHSSEPAGVVFVVLLRQRVASGDHVAEARPSMTLRVVPHDGGWRVAEVVV
jgi:hypothetical protein